MIMVILNVVKFLYKNCFNVKIRAVIIVGFLLGSCSNFNGPEKPNFVIILFDDLGWDDLGIHRNSFIETPTVDLLATQSAQFDNFYVNPVCAASRASLLTGRHFLRTGVSHVHGGKDFMSLDEITIAQVLAQNGYNTAMWGKWHNGDAHNYFPWQRGFNEALSLRLYQHRNAEGYLNGEFVSTKQWADEVIVDHAIEFMKRNKDNPFFAFVSLLSPHTPLNAPDNVVQKYINKGLSRNLATIYAMVDFSDQQLGRLFQTIDIMGLANNTIVMLLSDNGPAINLTEISDHDRAIRYVNGYRGHKGDIWENGVKSPLFIRWPHNIQAQNIPDLVDITDIFPTLIEIAGISFDEPNALDGLSFKQLLLHGKQMPHRLIYNYANKGWPPSLVPYNSDGNYNEYQPVNKSSLKPVDQVISVRTPRYKLMLNPGIDGSFDVTDRIVLIDMHNDPKEKNNLSLAEPFITRQLSDSLQRWYYDILDDSMSYAPPLLHLKNECPSSFRATWVSQLSENLLNTVTSVKRWQGQESWVEYRMNVPRESSFEIELAYKMEEAGHPEVNLQCESQSITNKLNDQDEGVVGVVKFSSGIHNFRISIKPDPQGKSIDELIWLHLNPVD